MMNDSETIFRGLAEILECEDRAPGPNTVIGVGAMNSLRTLEIIALIDETFGVTVPSDELTACSTYGAVVSLARASVQEQADAE